MKRTRKRDANVCGSCSCVREDVNVYVCVGSRKCVRRDAHVPHTVRSAAYCVYIPCHGKPQPEARARRAGRARFAGRAAAPAENPILCDPPPRGMIRSPCNPAPPSPCDLQPRLKRGRPGSAGGRVSKHAPNMGGAGPAGRDWRLVGGSPPEITGHFKAPPKVAAGGRARFSDVTAAGPGIRCPKRYSFCPLLVCAEGLCP